MQNKYEELDALDYLTPEVAVAVDRLGYAFLDKNGYHTIGAAASERKRKRLSRELERNGHELSYVLKPGKPDGTWIVYFVLNKKGKEIARSKSMKLIFGKPGEGSEKI